MLYKKIPLSSSLTMNVAWPIGNSCPNCQPSYGLICVMLSVLAGNPVTGHTIPQYSLLGVYCGLLQLNYDVVLITCLQLSACRPTKLSDVQRCIANDATLSRRCHTYHF